MGKRNACLVINPRGGQNVEKLAAILAVLSAGGYKTSVVLKEYSSHTEELARRAAEEGYDVVISYGGDGTLNQVINGVLNAGSTCTVAMIPGGTANLWATEIGIPLDNPVKAVLALLASEDRLVDAGHVMIDNLQVPDALPNGIEEDISNRKVQATTRGYFLLMAGLGLDAVVMQGVSKPLKYKVRHLAVGLSAAREIPAYRPFPIEVRDAHRKLLWQGEALQVVIGNTRLYADIFHMTPNAYIDDGLLDVCVITTGSPLESIQQLFSLLLRRQPDNLTAEFFQDSQLFIKVPSNIGLQLDGSAVKQKDYLNKKQKNVLQTAAEPGEVLVEYGFEAVPQLLHMAVPRVYDNTLFHENTSHDADEQVSVEDLPVSPTDGPSEQAGSELLARLRAEGRKVRVTGVYQDIQQHISIIAGTYIQHSTGIAKPAAVRVDKQAGVLTQSGHQLSLSALAQLKEGREIIVDGKKDKRGVIEAQYIIV